MAQKRMFSLKVVDTDEFLDMSLSTQALYFHLTMRADDDGFVSNSKKIMRMIGSQEDELKVLFSKQFIIPFDSGICVIRHWRINNYLRSDRYSQTQYLEEKKQLNQTESGEYELLVDTDGIPDGIPSGYTGKVSKDKIRLDKISKGKNRKDKKSKDSEATTSHYYPVNEVIKLFEEINPACKTYYSNKTQRSSAWRLIEEYGLDRVKDVINILQQSNAMPYVPTIVTPYQLEQKWVQLENALKKKKNEIKSKKPNVI